MIRISMYQQPSKRKKLIKLIAVYVIMTLAVIAIVTLIVFFVLGYRLDTGNGRLEQYAFLQFSSIPSGATVTIDGMGVGSKTPNKSSVPAGKHEVVMWRDGYETWRKNVDIKAGTLTWLNYALLIPKKLTVEPVASYESIYMTLASPEGHYILVEGRADTPTFDLVDLGSDTIKSTKLTISASLYSEPTTTGVTHKFTISKWDEGGRYVLIKHTYGDKYEWLVMDTQDVALTKNITRLFDVSISSISFYGTSGNIFYVLDLNDIRKLDLSAETISKPLVSSVTSFEIYNDSNIITYVGNGTAGTSQRVVGIYREGDSKSYVLRTVTSSADVPLYIATAHYFNEDYVVIAEGKKVDILSGSYPDTTSDSVTSLKVIASFMSKEDIHNLMFSPTGEYVFIQSGAYFASYDLEYQTFTSSTIEGTGDVPTIKWIDNNHVWSDYVGNLTIREFDGTNSHSINPVLAGQDATLTHNGRFLYSVNKSTAGYQLQRVRMILP
jgi:hypothetical protein